MEAMRDMENMENTQNMEQKNMEKKNKSSRPLLWDLTSLERFVFNTVFLLILGYTFVVSYYSKFLTEIGLGFFVSVMPFILIFIFFITRIVTHHKKAKLQKIGENWLFDKRGKKLSFEVSDVSAVKKSALGLFGSVVLIIKGKKIRVPAETDEFEVLVLENASD